MIDLHCHILPGIDDGPGTIEESLALGRAAVALGVRTIVATPHVSRAYRNDAQTIASLTEALGARIAAEDLELDVRPGAEIAMTMIADIEPEDLSRLALGDGGWLLVECPFTPLATGFDLLLLGLQGHGHRIVLAHPERSPIFHRDPEMLGAFVRSGMLLSVTAGSLVGRFGGEVRRFALRLAHEELMHNVASDAHNLASRPPGMRAELREAGLEPLTDWLTCKVPAAILAGEEIPPRPAAAISLSATRGPWWRRFAKRA
jgi:protein-tyrosine phosphatase